MTIFHLEPIHKMLTLRSAMSLAYKTKNFILASFFAEKIIEMCDINPNITKPEVMTNAKKVY